MLPFQYWSHFNLAPHASAHPTSGTPSPSAAPLPAASHSQTSSGPPSLTEGSLHPLITQPGSLWITRVSHITFSKHQSFPITSDCRKGGKIKKYMNTISTAFNALCAFYMGTSHISSFKSFSSQTSMSVQFGLQLTYDSYQSGLPASVGNVF